MRFDDCITLEAYADKANKQFGNLQDKLSDLESSFQTRMNGKTTASIIGSIVGTACWIIALGYGVYVLYYGYSNMINSTYVLLGGGVALCLLVIMLIEEILDFKYYGKITTYKKTVSQLRKRVEIGKSSIKANHDEFMASRANGWNYALNAATSIPEEAESVVSTVKSMESIKKGFINSAKNFLFFSSVIAVTIVGCIALFSRGCGMIEGITSNFWGSVLSNDAVTVLSSIGVILTVVGMILLSKLVWSKTDCNVNNLTLFIVALGPIAYLALVGLATLLVNIIAGILYIVVMLAIGAAVIACGCAMSSGS